MEFLLVCSVFFSFLERLNSIVIVINYICIMFHWLYRHTYVCMCVCIISFNLHGISDGENICVLQKKRKGTLLPGYPS